jgi:capsular exopolysaccharide synthesis family protein
VDLGGLWAAIYRYPRTTAVTVLLAAAAAAAVWTFLPLPRLTGYMTFQISAAPNTLITPVGSDRTDFNMYRQRQATAVKSRVVLNEALKKPGVADLPMLRDRSDPLNWLENQVRVDFRQGPEFMRVAIEGDDADQLETVLGSIGTAYTDDVRHKEGSLKRKEKQLAEKTLAAYTEELANQQRDIRNFQESVGAADPTVIATKQKIADERHWMTQKQLFDVQAQIRRLDIDLKAAQARSTATSATAAESLVQLALKADPEVQRLTTARKALVDQIARQKERLAAAAVAQYTKKAEEELAAVQKDLEKATAQVRADTAAAVKQQNAEADKAAVAGINQQLAVLREYEKVLAVDAEAQLKKVKALDGGQFDIAERQDKIAEKQKVAQMLASRVEAIRVELDTPSRAELLEPPTTVPGIEGYRRVRYAGMAFVGVLALGVGFNFLRVVRDPRVVGAACVETRLGLPIVGMLPRIPATAGRPVADNPPDWQVALSESLTATRLVMLNKDVAGTPIRTVLVVSAMSGEGKSSVALQLAISLAQAGHKTALVDGDMRRPELHVRLGLPAGPGLAEFLRGEFPMQPAVLDTGMPGLSFLPAGRWDQHASRSVCSGGWKSALSQLADSHEYVVVDSTPLLPVADGLAMAKNVDGVVMSVLRDVSQLQNVAEAQKRLAAVGANVLGVVLSGAAQVLYRYTPSQPVTVGQTVSSTDALIPLVASPENGGSEVRVSV